MHERIENLTFEGYPLCILNNYFVFGPQYNQQHYEALVTFLQPIDQMDHFACLEHSGTFLTNTNPESTWCMLKTLIAKEKNLDVNCNSRKKLE